MPTSPTARLIPQLRRAVLAADANGLTDGQLLGEYLRTRDDAAFAALVRRHGPMVLGVCRRVVGEHHAADDAFQAAFLVLARRAHTVRPREQVGNFLFGVAYRTALKARAVRARRLTREKQVATMPHPLVAPADAWPDLLPVLDTELARLPDKFRLPVVLCDLESRPQREVARQLGLPPATLANRLATARRTLAKRLTERGIVLSGGAVATLVSANAASAVPPTLAAAAVRVGATLSGAVAGTIPAPIVHLSDGVIRMMVLAKLKSAAIALAVVCTLAGGVGIGTGPALYADEAPAAAQAATPARPALGPQLSDEQFLRRVCLDLRGTPPTALELALFRADPDADKRRKIIGWLIEPGEKRAQLLDTSESMRRGWVEVLNNRRVLANQTIPYFFGHNVAGRVNLNEVVDHDRAYRVELLLTEQNLQYDSLALWFLGGQAAQAKPAPTEPPPADRRVTWSYLFVDRSDDEFLKSVCQEAYGRDPTALEREYFVADMDPEKRTKLVDLVLRDPAVAKRVGDGWRKTILESGWRVEQGSVNPGIFRFHLLVDRDSVQLWTPKAEPALPARLDALLLQLLDGKRADEAVLDALAATTLGRLPTESEKKLILTSIGKVTDKSAAWREVLQTLASTAEANKHASELKGEPAAPPKK